MRTIALLGFVALWLAFCGLLVWEGHWIAGIVMALIISGGVKIK